MNTERERDSIAASETHSASLDPVDTVVTIMHSVLLHGGRHVRRVLQLNGSHTSQVAEVNFQIATECAETARARPPYAQNTSLTKT